MMAADAEETGGRTDPCAPPGISLRRRGSDRRWRLRSVYLQCYFLTIATILGTGILGLPVTIAHAGMMPFLISFLVGFCVQALLIYLFVELLQKCQAMQLESLKTGVAECIMMSPVNIQSPTFTDDEEEEEYEADHAAADTGLLQPHTVTLQEQAENLQPNLYLLGCLFLSPPMSCAFSCILLFQLRLRAGSMQRLSRSVTRHTRTRRCPSQPAAHVHTRLCSADTQPVCSFSVPKHLSA